MQSHIWCKHAIKPSKPSNLDQTLFAIFVLRPSHLTLVSSLHAYEYLLKTPLPPSQLFSFDLFTPRLIFRSGGDARASCTVLCLSTKSPPWALWTRRGDNSGQRLIKWIKGFDSIQNILQFSLLHLVMALVEGFKPQISYCCLATVSEGSRLLQLANIVLMYNMNILFVFWYVWNIHTSFRMLRVSLRT